MANMLRRKKTASTDVATVGNQTAAVQRMDLPPIDTGWSMWRQAGTPLLWQQEAYRHYDRCGELHFSAGAVASMISRCGVQIWTRQPDGEPGKPVTEGKIAKLSGQLAGAEEKPEILRLAGLNDFLVGDYYTCVETVEEGEDKGKDRWFVLSVSQVRRQGEHTLQFERPLKYGGGLIEYHLPDPRSTRPKVENKVILWRTFTEHAQLTDQPDSSVRAAIPILNLIEQYDKRSSAQNDSRLAGAGVLFLPHEFAFPIPPPGPPGSPPTPTTPVDAFEAKLGEAMSKTLRDPANARSLVPIMATVKGELIDKVKWLTFETPLDEQTMQRLDQCIRRLGLALDMPPELLMGVGTMNHWCVDTQTQILTREGWRYEHELTTGDVVLTLNHKTGVSEWQPVLDIYRAHVENERMASIQRRNHSSLTTRNHRWATVRNGKRRFVYTKDLTERDHVPTAAPHGEFPAEAKYADDLVELAAWYWTEGSEKPSVRIAQSHTVNPDRVDRIRGCLSRVFGAASEHLDGAAAPQWREAVQLNKSSFGGPITVFYLNKEAGKILQGLAPNKIVRLDFIQSLTRAQLELFIDVSCQGDGWHYRSGRLDMWQRNPEALQAFELALVLSGRMVTSGTHGPGTWVSPHQRTSIRPVKGRDGKRAPEDETYTGTVWCPVTPNGTWFAKRAGTTYFTGNSAWASEQSTQKTFIAPRLARWCHAVTVAWMNAKLRSMGEDPTKYMVWFDMAALTVRPDRQADALALWDRGLVQDEVVLDAGNWPKSAGHTPDSYKRWLLTTSLTKNPQLMADPAFVANLNAIGIKLETPAPAQPALPAGAEVAAPGRGAAIESAPSEPTSTRTPAQEALVAGAEMAAMHSLAVAGKKLLSRPVRDQLLNEFAGRTFDLHTRVPVEGTEQALALLEGTWDLLPALGIRTGTDVRILRESLSAYCAGQLVASRPHDADTLTLFLSEAILAAGHRFCGPAGCRNRMHPQQCNSALQVTS
jgi:hypothetical protein